MITDKWHTGDGISISFEEIIKILKESNCNEIHIGTDSQKHADEYVFATAICYLIPNNKGGNYFFRKYKTKCADDLFTRLFKEVSDSLEVCKELVLKNNTKISIHIDANTKPVGKSYRYKNQLEGFVESMGYDCHLKPDSWASWIADTHTK